MPRRENIRKLRRAARKLDRRAGQREMGQVLRYASGKGASKGLQNSLRSLFGRALGDFIAELADVFAGGTAPRQNDIDDAIRLLQDSGYNVQRRAPGDDDPTPPPQTRQYGPLAKPAPPRGRPGAPANAPSTPEPPGTPPAPASTIPAAPVAPVSPPPAVPRDPVPPRSPAPPSGTIGGKPLPDLRRVLQTDDQWPDEHTIDTRKLKAVLDPGEGIWATQVFTPESSNVYSFAYDEDEGILYVTYKADARNGTGKKLNEAGPMYSYGGRGKPVPAGVYAEMKAASSRGKFVWDKLRIRGSIWGHQYQYTLVSPSMAGGQIYVPRKATRRGFRVRNVATAAPVTIAGQRRRKRPSDRSNLPERLL